MATRFVQFTEDGQFPVWVNADLVRCIRPVFNAAKSRIYFDNSDAIMVDGEAHTISRELFSRD